MNHTSTRLVAVVGALLLATSYAAPAIACCGQSASVGYAPAYSAGYAPVASTSYYAPTAYTAAYAPTYTTAYSPVVVQQQPTGWYPGYWLSRANSRIWNGPRRQVVAYQPTTFAQPMWGATAAPACSTCASYAPAAPTCSTCTAGYAPSYTASYAPACETGCSSCSAAPVVTQVSYEQPAAAPCCAASAQPTTVAAPPQTYVAPPTDTSSLQPTPAPGVANQPPANTNVTNDPPPTFNNTTASPSSTTTNRPAEPTTTAPPETPVSPEPAGDTNENDPYKVNKDDNSTYLEMPKLFNPKDRTARRSASIAPVHTAVYKQPVATRTAAAATVTRGPVSDEQARIDAIGWTSASK